MILFVVSFELLKFSFISNLNSIFFIYLFVIEIHISHNNMHLHSHFNSIDIKYITKWWYPLLCPTISLTTYCALPSTNCAVHKGRKLVVNSSQLGQKDYNETAIAVSGNYETVTVHKRYPVNANDAKIQGRNSTSLKKNKKTIRDESVRGMWARTINNSCNYRYRSLPLVLQGIS